MRDAAELDTQLLDLLVEWEERKAAGTPATPEALCRTCPERLDDLRRQVRQIGQLDSLLALAGPAAPPDIPGFELLDEIGRGGMGAVYRARDVMLDCIVAVKVPFAVPGAIVHRQRFEREARTLAKLRHPGIVPVHAAGLAGEVPYLVMEYLPGGNLADRLKQAAVAPEWVAALVERVARAVSYAHAAGIIHRDLKPSNILLDAAGQPFVSDFGVAAILAGEPLTGLTDDTPGDGLTEETRLTRTGMHVGTPAYAAPETRTAGANRPTPASDVWSLGVVLSECLTGQLPDRNGIPVRTALPRGLEAIVRRCLAIDPANRYPTTEAVAVDLGRWQRRVRVRRRLKAAGLVGLVAVVVLGAIAALAWPKSPAARHHDATDELLAAFQRDGRVALVPPVGAPRSYTVRVNQALAQTGVTTDGFFFADCPRPCLVELLPDVPCDHYSITADLCQTSGHFDADVGLYCGHAEVVDDPAPGHRFLVLSFADLGLLAHKYPGPGGKLGSALHLRGFRYRPPDPPGGETWSQHGLGLAWYDPPAVGTNSRPPWHRVRLDVSPDTLRAACDKLALPPAGATAMSNTVRSPRYPRGGVGVYVCGGSVLMQNVVLERVVNP